jgi:hypothetical protein
MDEAQTRDHINQHADAIVRGDMDAILADFSEELRRVRPRSSTRCCRNQSRGRRC